MRKLLAFAFVLLLPVVAQASGAITLTATTDSLEVATSSTATTDYRCSFVDNTSTTFTPGSSNGQITTATDTTIVAAPAASTQRKISGCSIHVVSGGAQTVTVQFDTSGTERIIFVASLTTGWSLQWNEEGRFEIHDSTGTAVALSQIWDGTDKALVSAGGALLTDASATTQPISAASLPLPTGAATAANQDGIVKDGAGDTTQANVSSGRLHVDGSGVTQPVSGTVTATATDLDIRNLNATDDIVQARGAAADGAAVAGNPVLIAGQDGTNAQSIKTDSTGSVQVDVETMPTTTVTATDLDVQIGGSDSLTIGTFPDNEPINVAQINGVAPLMGNGASGTGAQRVTIANDSTGVLATVTTVTNLTNLPNEGQQTAANSISVTPDTDNDAIGATAAAVPGEAMYVAGTDGTNVTPFYVDPCEREARTVYRVDIVTATTTEIAAATASEFYYVCSINLVTAAANNVIIVEDDTATNCPSPTAGVSSGGTTAAEGWNFAANGGIVVGNGQKWIMKTGTANRSFCIITSAGTQLSGTITYVSAP